MPKFEDKPKPDLPDYFHAFRQAFGEKEMILARGYQFNPRAEMAWELLKALMPSLQHVGFNSSIFETELVVRRVFELTDHFLVMCRYENLIQELPNPFEVDNEPGEQ